MSQQRGFRNSLGWATVMTTGQRGISLVFTVVLAAILGPRDYGIVSIALVYIALIEVFLEQGIGTALIQRKDLEPEHLDVAFWLNLVWSLVLMAVSVLASIFWAKITGLPQLENVIDVLSIVILFTGLTVVQQAILQREMQFRKLAIRSNIAALAGGICGLALALTGYGYWALVGQQIALSAVSVVLLWTVSGWRPHFRFSRGHAKGLLSFSLDVFAANLAGFLNRRADALLIGVFFDPVVVGVYRLADRLIDSVQELTMRPVGTLSLPYFSRLQDDPSGLRAVVDRCFRVASYATVPAMLIVAAVGNEILAVIGPEWEIGGTALKLLALVGIVKSLIFFTGPLLFAVNRPRLRAGMLWSFAALSAVSVVVAGVLLGDTSNSTALLGMGLSRAVIFLGVFLPISLGVISWIARIPLRVLLARLPAPFASGGAAIAAVAVLQAAGALDAGSPVLALVEASAVAVSVAGATILLLEPGLRVGAATLLRRALPHLR